MKIKMTQLISWELGHITLSIINYHGAQCTSLRVNEGKKCDFCRDQAEVTAKANS